MQFRARSFDLREFRSAVRRRASAAELQAIVRGLEQAVGRDQASFAERLRDLGGRVVDAWWLVNGCSIEVKPEHLARLRSWPNVRSVDPDTIRRPHLVDAADNVHHGSAAANLMKTAAGQLITGKGVAVAVLDTGADVDSGTKKRPHACYYPMGDPRQNGNGGIRGSLLLEALKLSVSLSGDDAIGHGTAVAGCVGANRWNSQSDVGNGVAPGTGIVSMNITDRSGWSKDSWIVSAWQTIAALRTTHNIGAANNSFSGSPNLLNIVQMALDSAALNADMLICVSAGNSGNYTAESQSAFNGLAVGSIDKTVKTRSGFSAIGPLFGTGRTYPDITAVGNQVVLPLIDAESAKTKVGGTSYAAPMVAGTAALVRQAAPGLDANAVRAILLNTVEFRTSNRNAYGLGSLRADAAVTAALSGNVLRGTVRTNRKTARFPFKFTSGGPRRVTVSWMRQEFTSNLTPDLNLRIIDGRGLLVVKDYNSSNSYESITFTAVANTSYTAEVVWANPPALTGSLAFAIAGITQRTAPTLKSITPNTVTAYRPIAIEIEGTSLATATKILFGATAVTEFTILDDSRIAVLPPNLLPIGPIAVQVETPFGVSAAGNLTIAGPGDPIFTGATSVVRSSTANEQFDIYSGKRWRSLVLVSDSNQPSVIPGLYKLGIGNNWQGVVTTVVYLNHDDRGVTSFQLPFPTSLPKITVYFQTLSIDPAAITTPYPVSNVHTLMIN